MVSVKDILKKKQKEEDEGYKKVGLSFMKSRTTEARIEIIDAFKKQIYDPLEGKSAEDKLKNLLERLENIDYILRMGALPYIGAMDVQSDLVWAWEACRSMTHDFVLSIQHQMELTEQQDTANLQRKSELRKEHRLLTCLLDHEPYTLQELKQKTKLPSGELREAIMFLQVNGAVNVERKSKTVEVSISPQGEKIHKKLATHLKNPKTVQDDVRTRRKKDALLRKIVYLWTHWTSRHALFVTGVAWRPEHSAENVGLVVHQPQGRGGIWPADYGRQDYPPRGQE